MESVTAAFSGQPEKRETVSLVHFCINLSALNQREQQSPSRGPMNYSFTLTCCDMMSSIWKVTFQIIYCMMSQCSDKDDSGVCNNMTCSKKVWLGSTNTNLIKENVSHMSYCDITSTLSQTYVQPSTPCFEKDI